MQLHLAVIILNYFGFEYSVSCIESVKQSLKSTVFLVDNSANQSEKKNLENTFNNETDIKLIFPSENLGFAAGVNLALREAVAAGYQNFLLLNNDAVLLNDAGDLLAKSFKDHPGSLIAPSIICGENSNTGNYYQKYLGLISSTPYLNGLGSLYYFSGCTLGFDKNVLDKIGYLDETFFFYGEDIEFCYRAQKNNIPLILMEDSLVLHKGSKSAKITSFFYEFHMIRSHFLLCFKIVNNPVSIIISFVSKFLSLSLRALIRSIRHKSFIPIITLLTGAFPLKIRPQIKTYPTENNSRMELVQGKSTLFLFLGMCTLSSLWKTR